MYEDIIDLPHHVSTTRPHLTRKQRAAQFSPYAALKGHKEKILEVERETDEWNNLSDEEIEKLENTTAELMAKIHDCPEIKVTYFVPDENKSGGSYKIYSGHIRKIDETQHVFVFKDNTKIQMQYISNIEMI